MRKGTIIAFVTYLPVASMILKSGYGLVVEHVLAKDETGVRFSLPAQIHGYKPESHQKRTDPTSNS